MGLPVGHSVVVGRDSSVILLLLSLTLLTAGGPASLPAAAQTDKPGPVIQQCTKTFDNGAGTGVWETPANWNPDGAPGSGDTACIDGTFTVTLSTGPVTLAGLEHTSSGPLTISGATLTVTGTTTTSGTLRLNNGAVFNNNGTYNTGASAHTVVSTSGVGTFNNNGTYNKTAMLEIVNDEILTVFNNSGTVNLSVINGGLALKGGGNCGSACNGSFVITAGTLTFTNGTFDFGPSSSISGGKVTFSGGTVNHAGTYNISGFTAIFGGTVNFTGTVLNAGALSLFFLGTPGTVNFSTGEAVPVATVSHSSNTLTGSDTVNVSGLYTWSGGTQAGTGTTNANGGMILSGPGDKMLSGRTLVNAGTANLIGTGSLLIGSGGVFQNNGTFDLQGDAAIASGGGAAAFNNAGTFTKSGGTNSAINIAFNNSGTVNASAGTLLLNLGGNCGSVCNGAFNVASALAFGFGTFDLGPSSSITGAGTVDFSNGTVNDAGTYNVTGATTLSGTVTFNGMTTMGAVTQTGGTLGGSGTVTMTSLYTWSAGTQSGSGTTNANGGLTLDTSNAKSLSGRTLNSPGTVTVSGAGNLAMASGAVFNNNGAYKLLADTSVLGSGTFNTAGSFTKEAGVSSSIETVFNNRGTLSVSSGALVLSGGGSCGGACNGGFQTSGSGSLQFTNPLMGSSTFDLGASSSVSGVSVTFGGATVNLAGTYNVTNTTLNGGTASFNATATTLGLIQTGGTLGGSGAVTITGSYDWSGGTHSGSGATNANLVTLSGSSVKTLSGRTLTSTGTVTISGTGNLSFGTGAVFSNNGPLDLQTEADFTTTGSLPRTFNNNGTFTKSGGAESILSVEFNNNGTLAGGAGILTLNAGGTGNGAFNTTGTLKFAGGTFTFGAPSSITAASTVEFSTGTVNTSGTYNVTSNTVFSGANVTFTGNVVNVGTVALSAGMADFSSGETILPVGVLTHSGGTLAGSDTITTAGMYDWSGGTQSGAGITNANGGITLSGTLNNKVLAGRTLNNPGTATLTGTGSLLIGNGGIFNNTGTLELQTDAGILSSGGVGTVNNPGAFTKLGGGAMSTVNVVFNNGGTVNASSGELQLAGGGNCGGTCNGSFNTATTLTFGGGTFDLGGGATLSGAGTVKVTGGAVNNMAGTTMNAGMLNLTGGTINFSTGGGITLSTVIHSGGTLTGSDIVTVNGTYTWSGGTQSGSGRTNTNGGLTLSGSGSKSLLTRMLSNPATATVSDAGALFISTGGVFENDGTFDLQSNAPITAGGGTRTFNNNGTFTKSGGGGLSTIDPTFNNFGTVNASSGEILLTGGGECIGACDGTFNVSGKLNFGGGTFTLSPSASVVGAGSVEFSGAAIVNVPANYNVMGNTIISGSGKANFTGPVLMGSLTQTGGELAAASSVAISGSYDWSGGRQTGAGTTTANGGILFGGSSSKTLTGRTLTNPATATFSGAGSLVIESGGALSNAGTFDLQTGAGILAAGNPPRSASNSGTFIKSGGTQSTIGVDYTNSGTVDIATGSVNFSAGFGQTSGSTRLCSANALFFNLGGGIFRAIPPGPCGITGNLTNTAGTVFAGDGSGLPTVVNVTGDYTQGAGAIFSVPIGGTLAGGAMTNHGQLNISGAAMLSGTLSASLIGGFAPAAGQNFTVMTYGARMGNFTATSLPNISPLSWHLSQGPTSVVLSPVAAGSPIINPGGSVNAASFTPGAAVAPGGIAAIFGSNLATSLGVAGSIPLPTTLGGATMKFNVSQSVPKFFAADSQVNIQIPWELQGASSANLTDTVNGITSPIEPVSLAMFAPGLFSTNQAGTGQGAILIANTATFAAPPGSIPGAQSRAAMRGVDFLEIYCTGLGAVTNQPATGNAAGSNPLSTTTSNASVTIGGAPATVLFSGLAPGFVGLYVVTLQVPAGAPVGDAVNVILTIGGMPSNTVTIAVE